MFVLLVVMVIALLLTFNSINLAKWRKENSLRSKLPGPRLPIVGSALHFLFPIEKMFSFVLSLQKNYGDRILLYACGYNCIVLIAPEDLEKLLKSKDYLDKGLLYKFLKPVYPIGLLASNVEKWKKHRKLLAPTFHTNILQDFQIVFNEQAQILVEVLNINFFGGQEKDICPYIDCCTFDAIGETAMGIKFGTQRNGDTEYMRKLHTLTDSILRRITNPLLWPEFIFNLSPPGRRAASVIQYAKNLSDLVIKQREELRMERADVAKEDGLNDKLPPKRRLVFLDLLLETRTIEGNDLTHADVRAEVDTFIAGGQETTSSTISSTVFLLSCHQNFQAKVLEELDGIFGDDKTRPITGTDLMEMKYLEMCIKESLRLFPPVPFFTRHLTNDLVLDHDVLIPAGCEALIPLLAVHRNEKVYPEPGNYLPDRFLPENVEKRHPYAFIPFSAGPRNCIGQRYAMMEAKIILANIFRNFRSETSTRLQDVVMMTTLVNKPRDGFKVRLLPR